MDSEWERHKETIRHLYLHQDKTLKQVMKVMKDVHNFQATYSSPPSLIMCHTLIRIPSAGQFERQIQKWCFRKNLTQVEWQFAVRRIKKRKREGKDTELAIDGMPIASKKLKKAIVRYGEGSTLDILAHQQRESTLITRSDIHVLLTALGRGKSKKSNAIRSDPLHSRAIMPGLDTTGFSWIVCTCVGQAASTPVPAPSITKL